MKNLLVLLSLLLTPAYLTASSVIGDLADEIAVMQDGDQLHLGYSFEGCFGPYYRGSFDFELIGDTIHFVSKSYHHNEKEPFVEAGKYERGRLVDLLDRSRERKSTEILGNVINYRITGGGEEFHQGVDRIDQRHFIEFFHPFTQVFAPKEFVIPKLSSGGIAH